MVWRNLIPIFNCGSLISIIMGAWPPHRRGYTRPIGKKQAWRLLLTLLVSHCPRSSNPLLQLFSLLFPSHLPEAWDTFSFPALNSVLTGEKVHEVCMFTLQSIHMSTYKTHTVIHFTYQVYLKNGESKEAKLPILWHSVLRHQQCTRLVCVNRWEHTGMHTGPLL